MINICRRLGATEKMSEALSLTTVVATSGSTPQKPGSSALFNSGRLIYGTVGGGIVENQVSILASECASTGESFLKTYSLDSDMDDAEAGVCGGEITILIDGSPAANYGAFSRAASALDEGKAGVLVTIADSGVEERVTIHRHWFDEMTVDSVGEKLPGFIGESVREMVKEAGAGQCTLKVHEVATGKNMVAFLETVAPLPRLIIAGAGHVGKAVSHIGHWLGFEVTVIDDRPEYASVENLPDADKVMVMDIGEAMKSLRKDASTYIVIVTRGHSHDAEALRPCIGSGAAYTGMMGSRKKVARMHELFINKGWATEEEWSRIYTPVGIAIGAVTVNEIAVSIAAQIVELRNAAGKK